MTVVDWMQWMVIIGLAAFNVKDGDRIRSIEKKLFELEKK